MKINTKTKLKLIIIMFSITMFITTIFSTTVLAANLNVNVEFDGKKIEMTSETPEMEWNINNVLPGQSMETLLIINSTGSKEVKVELGAEITDNPKLTEELIIKILNNKTSETLYEGKISELENVTLKIPSKETSQLKVMISIPEEASNEIQNDNYTVKFKLVAKGEKKILGNIQEDSELLNKFRIFF